MGLFARLFKKDKVDLSTNTNFIMTGKIFIYKPNEDFYHENKNEIKTYEKVYLSKLNQNKTLTSLDLKLEDDKYLHHYINKLTKINLEIDFIIDPLNQSDKKEYTYLSILEEKQKLYHTLIVNHINNLFLKKAALENILKRSPFMSMNKKNTIKNLISQIEIQIISMQNAITGNLLEITTLKDRIASLNLPKEENQVTLKRYEKIIEGFDISLNEITPASIAKATVQIEDELYNNKSLVSKLSEELSALLGSSLPPRETLTKLDKLIAQCIGIEELGNQKLTNLRMSLVKEKYKLLCKLAINNDYKNISFDDFFKEEQTDLEKVVLLSLREISLDSSNLIHNKYETLSKDRRGQFSPKLYEKIVTSLNEFLKDANGNFNIKEIINNPINLGVLYSLSSPKLIIDFFNQTMISSSILEKLSIPSNHIKYTETISISTLMNILNTELNMDNKEYLKFLNQSGSNEFSQAMISHKNKIMANQKVYALYKIYKDVLEKTLNYSAEWFMFEGVKEILAFTEMPSLSETYYYIQRFKPFILNLVFNHTFGFSFPDTIENFDFRFFTVLCPYAEYLFKYISKNVNPQKDKSVAYLFSFKPNLKSIGLARGRYVKVLELPDTVSQISNNMQPHIESKSSASEMPDSIRFNHFLNNPSFCTKEDFINFFSFLTNFRHLDYAQNELLFYENDDIYIAFKIFDITKLIKLDSYKDIPSKLYEEFLKQLAIIQKRLIAELKEYQAKYDESLEHEVSTISVKELSVLLNECCKETKFIANEAKATSKPKQK